VVNAAGQVVGQLSGGCGYDVYNTCNNIENSTVDGAFATYYDQVAPWLGSGGPCTDSHRRLARASFFLSALLDVYSVRSVVSDALLSRGGTEDRYGWFPRS
jgi:hypothetical protein